MWSVCGLGGRRTLRCVRAHGRWLPVVLSAAIATAQTPSTRDAVSNQLESFLLQLQRAVQSDDRNTVAAMIRYPITISIGGLRVPFADPATMLGRYDDVFTSPLRDSIARATVRPRAGRAQLTVAEDRYVVGMNDVVIAPIDGSLRIIAIAVPEFVDSGVPSTARAGAGTLGTRTQEPRRIAIRVGSRPTQIPGLLARNATDAFVLYLPKGQLAGVRLERVPTGSATIRVVHARSGAPLGARPSADGRFVTGRPTEGADYRIEVRRGATEEEAPLPYMLSLTLR
jgi:hypothetical protein